MIWLSELLNEWTVANDLFTHSIHFSFTSPRIVWPKIDLRAVAHCFLIVNNQSVGREVTLTRQSDFFNLLIKLNYCPRRDLTLRHWTCTSLGLILIGFEEKKNSELNGWISVQGELLLSHLSSPQIETISGKLLTAFYLYRIIKQKLAIFAWKTNRKMRDELSTQLFTENNFHLQQKMKIENSLFLACRDSLVKYFLSQTRHSTPVKGN